MTSICITIRKGCKCLKKTTTKSPTLFEKITSWIEDNVGKTLIITLLIIIVIPIFILLFSSYITWQIKCYISTDGLLGYIGTVIGGLLAFIVGLIALYQSKKTLIVQEESEIMRRKKEIFPIITVNVEKYDDLKYKVSIANNGKYSALGVYLYMCPFENFIVPGKISEKIFSKNKLECMMKEYNDDYFLNDFEKPNIISLTYLDIDNCCIIQDYKHTTDNIYCTEKTESF